MTDSLLHHSVEDFLDNLASRASVPGGGAAAALTVATAAGLAAMVARFTAGELTELAEQADELRASVCQLADADTRAYLTVRAAFRLPASEPDRRTKVTDALRVATEVPLRISESGAEVAAMSARLAHDGNPTLAGDARAAALLAEAATRAAAGLVRDNAELGDLDAWWIHEAEKFVRSAERFGQEASEVSR